VLYNVPANTGVDMTAPTMIKLSRHRNIIGLKDSGGDLQKMALVLRECERGFQVLAGSAGFLLPALVLGAVGGIAALANLAPRPLDRMARALREGALDEARAIQLRLVETNLAVTARFGVAGLKAALALCGRPVGVVRPPLCPLEADEHAALRAILVRAQLVDG
jgi:4-hydroxy-2-oxoglutarate aldolase